MDGITDSMDVNLRKLREMVKDREPWHIAVHGVTELGMTEQLNSNSTIIYFFIINYIYFKKLTHRILRAGRSEMWAG